MCYNSKPRESRDAGFFNPEIPGLEKRSGIGNPKFDEHKVIWLQPVPHVAFPATLVYIKSVM